MPRTLFISDLHLDAGRPNITQLFLDFLETRARGSDALYILGDLFEAWIGDDDQSAMNLSVCRGLRQCAASGTPVFVMHGNRDFLLGEQFAEQCNCTLLQDPALVDLYGIPTLLMHGDLLCTDDAEYQAFRETARNPQWQAGFLKKPLEERRRIAVDMRAVSREKTSGKAESIMDVNQAAVSDAMTESQVSRLIHGHTHRPDVHELLIGGEPAQRIVLGDWYEQGSVLECSPAGCSLKNIAIS
jgi:UDP-2,3-diacylglucosamine hydrolase